MGRDKASLTLDGVSLLQRTVEQLRSISPDVILVGRESGDLQARSVGDEIEGVGPIGGLLAGLRAAAYPLSAVAACDHPFLNGRALLALAGLAPGYDAVIPRVDGAAQPLHAVYHRRSLTPIERYVEAGGRSLKGLLEELIVRWVSGTELEVLDPGLRSLLNVNTPEEWQRAREGRDDR
jgi:molybdopterin-guanine dinucleotide biosynthesis protein A